MAWLAGTYYIYNARRAAVAPTELIRLRFERGRVMQNLSSYLPDDEARKVAFELPSSNIEAERREVTLLCADLRNFSAIGEFRPQKSQHRCFIFSLPKLIYYRELWRENSRV